MASPPFAYVLAYEHQMRKETVKLLNDGEEIVAALEKARKDVNIKERFFITPASMSALTASQGKWERSRSPQRTTWQMRAPGDRPESGWKGRGKSKTKGKFKAGKGKDFKLHSHTPDGREICYGWNSQKERCRYNCGRVHCCQICFGNHPYHMCKQAGGSGKDGKEHKDTTGAGAGAGKTA